MSKGSISNKIDVVNSPPPSLDKAANMFENEGIMPPSGKLEDAGMNATNRTEPEVTPSKIPSWTKGSGYNR